MGNLSFSIHPRVWNHAEKKNTCGTPSKERRKRVIAAIEEHVELHPNDHMSRERIAKLKAMP